MADASSSGSSDASASSVVAKVGGIARFKGGWKCLSCDYTSVGKTDVVKHLRKHTGIKPFQCPHCTHKCSDKSNLTKHIETQHFTPDNESFIDVKACGPVQFEGGWKCLQCNYTSSGKTDVVKHIRKHTGIKPFQCPHCSHTASDKSNLNRHIFRHFTPAKFN